ncbi:MAG: electron transporter RnfC, partial [Firmicutes bacterium]|nr:electron transporter RnfC [Bacillota bacterium]
MPKGLFRGGIHPPENKERTATLRTIVAQRPSKVAVLLHQGSNCPLTPTVAKGDHVRMGQKVADTEEKWGVPAHSPVSGKIDSIGLVRTVSGAQDQAIFIVPDEEDVLDESCVPVDNVFSRRPEELIAMIREAGIVGMGGAEFPTHIKLSLPPKVEVDTLLLNGAECEPYLTADPAHGRASPRYYPWG